MPRNQKARRKVRSVAKRGRPGVSSTKVTAIAKMLSKKATHARIAKVVGVSKTTVDRVSKLWNAMAWQGKDTTDLSDLCKLPEGELSEARKKILQELEVAFTKASEKVPKVLRAAIIKGVVAARLRAKDILDPVPLDPRLAFAPQQVEPEHKPPSRLETQTIRKKLR